MEQLSINSKSLARIAVIQSLYQYLIFDGEKTVEKIIDDTLEYYNNTKQLKADYLCPQDYNIHLSSNYFQSLFKYIVKERLYIEDIINTTLFNDKTFSDQRLINLPPLVFTILCSGVGELKYFPKTSFKIIIDEFTKISSVLLIDHQISFVNLALDKLSKAIQVN